MNHPHHHHSSSWVPPSEDYMSSGYYHHTGELRSGGVYNHSGSGAEHRRIHSQRLPRTSLPPQMHPDHYARNSPDLHAVSSEESMKYPASSMKPAPMPAARSMPYGHIPAFPRHSVPNQHHHNPYVERPGYNQMPHHLNHRGQPPLHPAHHHPHHYRQGMNMEADRFRFQSISLVEGHHHPVQREHYRRMSIPEGPGVAKEDCKDANSPASPLSIPAPPSTKEPPRSAPPKLLSCPRSPGNATISSAPGPLRESRINNVKEEDEQRDESPKPKQKNPSIDDASLLLGLRTNSTSNSPATVGAVESEELIDDSKRDEPPAESAQNKPFPVPKDYPTRLSLPEDGAKLNRLHCFIRSDLLELFVVEPSTSAVTCNSSSVGRVGLRCVHCAMSRDKSAKPSSEDAPMAVIYPKSIAEMYRQVTSWQRCHLRRCRNLPPSIRKQWDELRSIDRSRGKTAYWVASAKSIGLVDCNIKAGGIRFEVDEEGAVVKIPLSEVTYD